ncbi:MAG: hypothetical protein ABI402_18660 [Ferruginibacter sp.]
MRKANHFFLLIILAIIGSNFTYGQTYYINTNDKKAEFKYYFRIMDSLVAADQNEQLHTCINCVKHMESMTKILSSGKTTYFGRLSFTEGDLKKWHAWYTHKFKQKR